MTAIIQLLVICIPKKVFTQFQNSVWVNSLVFLLLSGFLRTHSTSFSGFFACHIFSPCSFILSITSRTVSNCHHDKLYPLFVFFKGNNLLLLAMLFLLFNENLADSLPNKTYPVKTVLHMKNMSHFFSLKIIF
jgi:hypothetical protein